MSKLFGYLASRVDGLQSVFASEVRPPNTQEPIGVGLIQHGEPLLRKRPMAGEDWSMLDKLETDCALVQFGAAVDEESFRSEGYPPFRHRGWLVGVGGLREASIDDFDPSLLPEAARRRSPALLPAEAVFHILVREMQMRSLDALTSPPLDVLREVLRQASERLPSTWRSSAEAVLMLTDGRRLLAHSLSERSLHAWEGELEREDSKGRAVRVRYVLLSATDGIRAPRITGHSTVDVTSELIIGS